MSSKDETDEERMKRQRQALEEMMASTPAHPTDGMTPEERDAYYERRRKERWQEAHEIEARVPGLDWGPETDKSHPPYGGGMPWQADGWLGSRPFYARLRGNTAAITIFDAPEFSSFDDKPRPRELESAVISGYFEGDRALGGYAGDLDDVDEIVEFFERLIPEIKPISEENPSHYMIMSETVRRMAELHAALKEDEVTDDER